MTKQAKLIIISAVSLIMFAFVYLLVSLGIITNLEITAGEFARSLRNDIATPVLIVITNIGDKIMITGICIVFLIWPKTRLKLGVPLAASLIISTVINQLLKNIIGRQRPDEIYHMVEESGFSFPSGHSTSNTVLYITIIIVAVIFMNSIKGKIAVTILSVFMMLAVMFSRIYLGVHFLGDIMGGLFLGLFVSCSVYAVWLIILNKIDIRKKKRIKESQVSL